MALFALAAAVVAVIAIVQDFGALLWWWLGFIALHFAFGAVSVPLQRRRDG